MIDVRQLDADSWNDLVTTAPDATGFHLAESLDVLADETDTTVYRLAGFKGEEPCGLFPVFVKSFGPVTTLFSPPPGVKVNYLGPLLVNADKLKQRRRELRHSRFVDACIEWLDSTVSPSFTTVRTTPGYADVRPFVWNDHDATPRYTYVVDTTRDPDDLLAAFSSDARRNITDDHDTDYEIRAEGADAIDDIVTGVIDRHAEQDESFPIGPTFVRELYEAAPDGVVTPITVRADGEFLGGHVLVELNDTCISWLGVSDLDHDLPITDLLDWHCIQRAHDAGYSGFDLAGANNRRLSEYKSKFAPTLVPYYRVESGSWPLRAAASVYGTFK